MTMPTIPAYPLTGVQIAMLRTAHDRLLACLNDGRSRPAQDWVALLRAAHRDACHLFAHIEASDGSDDIAREGTAFVHGWEAWSNNPHNRVAFEQMQNSRAALIEAVEARDLAEMDA